MTTRTHSAFPPLDTRRESRMAGRGSLEEGCERGGEERDRGRLRGGPIFGFLLALLARRSRNSALMGLGNREERKGSAAADVVCRSEASMAKVDELRVIYLVRRRRRPHFPRVSSLSLSLWLYFCLTILVGCGATAVDLKFDAAPRFV